MSNQNQDPDQDSTISNYDEQTQELYDINKAVAQAYHEHLLSLLRDPEHPITRYVRGPDRELTDELISDWLIGYAPEEWRFLTNPLLEKGAFGPSVTAGVCVENGDKKYDFFRNRLMIPLFDGFRNIVGFTGRSTAGQEPKYLNTKETPVFKKSELLYGLHRAKRTILREKSLVLTEGNFDVTTLHRFGMTQTIGKGGTALTDQQVKTIVDLAESVTLIYDVDPMGAGQKAMIKDCETLLDAGLRVKVFHLPFVPEGPKVDADSWARIYMQPQEKPSRFFLAKHIEKFTEDGLMWLARIWSEVQDIDAQVENERRLLLLLTKISDEERRNKYTRKLAAVLDREPKDIARQLRKVMSEVKAAQQPNTYTDSESKDIKTDTVWYRNWDMSMMIKGRGGFNIIANNFHLFIKYRTKDEDQNLTWILELRPEPSLADPIFIEVTHDDWTTASRLKKIITGNLYAFKASDNELSELQAFLFSETKFAQAIKITRYGYHTESGVFFFANKAIHTKILEPDQFGMVHVEKEGAPFVLSMPQQNKSKSHRFTLTDTNVSVNEFFRTYAQAQLNDNALIPFCFYLMSLFRDVALRHQNFSPILFLKGGAGTGKSSMVRVLTAAFGKKQEGVNLGSKNTEVALVKLMSQASNCFIWMDEYHNELGTVEKLLQAMYDNDGYHRSRDNTSVDTDSISIHQALALTSNFLPKTEVFFSRCVFIPISNQEFTQEQTRAFKQLREWEDAGLGCLTVELLQYRQLVEKEYGNAFKTLHTALTSDFDKEKIPERFLANMAQLLTVSYILARAKKIAITETNDEESILNDLVRIGSENIRRQYRIMSEKTALSGFFETIQTLFDQHQIHEDIHFMFDRVGEVNMIRLWMPQLYQLYAEKYRRTNNEKPADRDTIQTELAILMEYKDWDSLKKSLRFRNDGEGHSNSPTQTRHNSCRVDYDLLQQKFGLTLELRRPKNSVFSN